MAEENIVNPALYQFGPMQPPQKPSSSSDANISEDRIVARLLAALQSQLQLQPQAAPIAPPVSQLSPEDQRLVSALASVHPAGRDVAILARDQITDNLFLVEYAFSPATGTRQDACALVFDDGRKTRIFGGS